MPDEPDPVSVKDEKCCVLLAKRVKEVVVQHHREGIEALACVGDRPLTKGRELLLPSHPLFSDVIASTGAEMEDAVHRMVLFTDKLQLM